MKEIIRKTDGVDKKTEYRLTCGKGSERARDCSGETFKIAGYVLFKDEKEMEILSFTDGERIISTNSKTAIQSFLEILDIFGDDEIEIEIITGETKAGRVYVDILLA